MTQIEEGIFVNQAKYTNKLLKNFGMQNAKILNLSANLFTKLDKDKSSKLVNENWYEDMITNKVDIVFRVCFYARYQKNPKKTHLCVIKRILDTYLGQKIMAYGILKTIALIMWDI